MAYAIKRYKAVQSPHNAPGGQLARWTNGALTETSGDKVRKLWLRSTAFDSAVTFLGSLCCIAVFHLFNFSLRRQHHPFVWPQLVYPFSCWFGHALRYYYYYVAYVRELGVQGVFCWLCVLPVVLIKFEEFPRRCIYAPFNRFVIVVTCMFLRWCWCKSCEKNAV